MATKQNDDPNVYLHQNAQYMYYLTTKNKSNERKVFYYNSFDCKHYLAKAHPFSSEADCSSIRVNYTFLVSIEELEAVKKLLNQFNMKTNRRSCIYLTSTKKGAFPDDWCFIKETIPFNCVDNDVKRFYLIVML